MDPFSRPDGDVPPHAPEFVSALGMTAVQFRHRIGELEAERAEAVLTELAEVDTYMADLDEELEFCRTLYVISAVTEIATLRAELGGAQYG
jgi:hypothetical protein